MKIYTQDTTNFNNNGLGFLTDALSCYITDEINGEYQLDMEYPKDGKLSEYLVEENIIKCKVADGTVQLFRIKIVQKNLKTIRVTAQHIFYDLLNNFLEDTYPQNLTCQAFLTHLLNNLNYSTSFTAYSNIAGTKSARYVRRNPVAAIMGDLDNSVLKLFGGELKRNNFTINLLSRVGSDNGVKLLFGKNIKGIDITIDITEMATRIMPQGFDGLLLPEKYIDSILINNYPTPKIVKMEFDDVRYDPTGAEGYANIQDAYTALRNKVQEQYTLGIDKPKININVDWIELSKTNEYKNYTNLETVNIGDTITADILGVEYETRVIATRYDVLKGMIINFQIGTFQSAITKTVSKIINDVQETLPSTLLEQAQADATQLITSAMGGYVYKTQSELYIMDTDNPTTATKVWRWNLNGLGYSSNGINGPYSVAMTMDGKIVANFITTGTLSADRISGGTLSGTSISIGNNFGVTTAGAMTAISGNIGGWDINSYRLFKAFGDYSFEIRSNRAANQPALYVYKSQGENQGYEFYVRPDGYLYAKNVNITGTISSSNATITGGSLELVTTGENDSKFKIIDSANSNNYVRLTARALKWFGSDGGVFQIFNYTSSPAITLADTTSNKSSVVSAEYVETPKIKAGNIDSGTCELNSTSIVQVDFNKTFSNTPNVVITPYTSASGTIAPKIREITTTYFKAIIGGSGFSDINCCWIAIGS